MNFSALRDINRTAWGTKPGEAHDQQGGQEVHLPSNFRSHSIELYFFPHKYVLAPYFALQILAASSLPLQTAPSGSLGPTCGLYQFMSHNEGVALHK